MYAYMCMYMCMYACMYVCIHIFVKGSLVLSPLALALPPLVCALAHIHAPTNPTRTHARTHHARTHAHTHAHGDTETCSCQRARRRWWESLRAPLCQQLVKHVSS